MLEILNQQNIRAFPDENYLDVHGDFMIVPARPKNKKPRNSGALERSSIQYESTWNLL